MNNKKYQTIKERKAAHCKVEMTRQAKIRAAGLCLKCRQPVTGHRKGMIRCEKCVDSARIPISDAAVVAIRTTPKVHGDSWLLSLRYGLPYETVNRIRNGKPFNKWINPKSVWYQEWTRYRAMTPDQRLEYERTLVKVSGKPYGSKLRDEIKALTEKVFTLSVENQRLREKNDVLSQELVRVSSTP